MLSVQPERPGDPAVAAIRELLGVAADADLPPALVEEVRLGTTVAINALLHSYRQPAHERALGAWLEARGLGPALLSHQLSPQPRLLPRAATTVVEAGLQEVLQRYLSQVAAALGPATRLRVMTSSGALQSPALLRAKDTILSGPAGGMVGAVAAARAAGWEAVPLLGFDMGGTSTDVFHVDPARGALAWERSSGTEVAGLPLLADMLPIPLQVAVERMAEAIRRISIHRGHDIRRTLLVSYGGAGGQHACALASRLGVRFPINRCHQRVVTP
ncbi:MAG: hydantoinase/oxoprolinase family protein [Cyanobium sp.]